jgi:hypothetical protein
MNARRRWAEWMMIQAGGPVPRYGSPEWLALPEGDRRKVAAVIVAAECWAREADELEDRLRVEIEFSRIAHKLIEDAEYVARRDAHRAEWKRTNDKILRAKRAATVRREIYGDDYGRSA